MLDDAIHACSYTTIPAAGRRRAWLDGLAEGAQVAIRPGRSAPRLAGVARTTATRLYVIERPGQREVIYSRKDGRRRTTGGSRIETAEIIEPTPDVLAAIQLEHLRRQVRLSLDLLRADHLDEAQCRCLLHVVAEIDATACLPAASAGMVDLEDPVVP